MIDKDRAMQEWIQYIPFSQHVFLFDWLAEHQGACAIVAVADTPAIEVYADGSALKAYNFALQISLRLSETTDSTNTDNMLAMRQWQEWLDEQETAGNYPEFGDNCSCYEIENRANMPQITHIDENRMAKYQFPARIIYLEVK